MSQQLSLLPDLLQLVPVTKGKPTQVQRSPVLGAYSKAAHAWMDHAAFVVERLNEVFGPCGCGWRYVHAPFEMLESEVLTEVALQFKVTQGGVNPVVWDAHSHNWSLIEDGEAWSWPIFSPGGRRPDKGTAPITDARKGAITDGLTKASSMIGVGVEVFKGLVRPGQTSTQPAKAVQLAKRAEPTPAQPAPSMPKMAPMPIVIQQAGDSGHGVRNGDGNGAATTAVIQASATTFWTLANKYTDRLDRATVSALAKDVVAGRMSWLEAQTILHDLIEDGGMPTFGSVSSPRETSQEKATGPVVQYTEKVRDPLDELFA